MRPGRALHAAHCSSAASSLAFIMAGGHKNFPGCTLSAVPDGRQHLPGWDAGTGRGPFPAGQGYVLNDFAGAD